MIPSTNMISGRLIIEAEKEVCLTSKMAKEIACESGRDDEYYFNRFFKTNAEVSPSTISGHSWLCKSKRIALGRRTILPAFAATFICIFSHQ